MSLSEGDLDALSLRMAERQIGEANSRLKAGYRYMADIQNTLLQAKDILDDLKKKQSLKGTE